MVKFAKRFFTHSGSSTRGVFKLSFDINTGAEELIRVGTENWDSFIQASKDSCDIHKVIARVRNGETQLLNQRDGMYGDFSQMPTTIHDLIALRRNAEALFDSLPEDRKKNFDSFDDFCKNAGTLSWLKQLGYVLPDDHKEEVKDNADS